MNQCDGCKLELPIENGIHVHPDKTGWDRLHMCCTKKEYKDMKEKVFNGTLDQCFEFIRANRFNVLLSMMEIKGNEVWAFRNELALKE